MSFRKAKFDVEVLALDVAEVTKPRQKCIVIRETKTPDPGKPFRLPRPRCNWPSKSGSRNRFNELAPSSGSSNLRARNRSGQASILEVAGRVGQALVIVRGPMVAVDTVITVNRHF
jgi:hypothetical protein